MGDILKFTNSNQALTNPSTLADIGAAVAMTATTGGAEDLLRLLRDGQWVFGADNVEPEADSRWAINPYSFEHGFISWHDSKIVGEVMVPVQAPLPNRMELPETPSSWDDQLSFRVQCISGEDKGVELLYKTTSVGGKRAVGKLAQAVSNRAVSGEASVVPVVILGVDSYNHKQYGRIYTPDLQIVDWLTLEGTSSAGEVEETPSDPEPAGGRRRRR